MKVFNEDVETCLHCKFYNLTQDKCEDLGLRTINKLNNFEFNPQEGIFNRCNFNKPLTKEDIESFGFTYADELPYNYMLNNTCRLNYHVLFYDLDLNNGSVFIDKKEYTITSKPHLKFILQTLNIL